MGGCGTAAKCVCILLSGWRCCFPSVRSTLYLPRLLCDRATYITTPTPLFLSPLPLHHSYSLSPSLHPSTFPPTLPLTCSHLSGVLVSPHFPFFTFTCSPLPHTPLARPPWVSFTSMMPHHYPCPTLSITQQLCSGASSFTRGLIPMLSRSRSQQLEQGLKKVKQNQASCLVCGCIYIFKTFTIELFTTKTEN